MLRRLALPAIVLFAAVLAVSQINQHLILASDNSSYVVLGQALAMGRGFAMINEPLAPAMNLYPPGYPLLLAAVLRVTGSAHAPMQAIIPMKLVAVAFYLACLPAFYALVRRRHGDGLASLATLLFAANPSVLILATEILSEMPFVFFTLAGVLAVERLAETPAGGGKQRALALVVLAALLLAGAYYMRTAALAILAAAPLYLLLKRKLWQGLALGALLVALALPWLLRSSAPPTPETPFFARSYIHQVFALAPYSDQTATPLDLIWRVVNNSLTYAARIMPQTIFPHISWLGQLAGAASALLALLFALGFILELRRGLRAGETAVAFYWLSLSLFVWVLGFRYIIVIIPFAILYLLVAVQWLGNALQQRMARVPWRPAIVAIAACALVLSAVAVDARRAERNLRTTRQQTLAQANAADPEWTSYLKAASWITHNTPADSVIMARKPDLLYLLTNRATVEYPYTQDGAILMSTMTANGVTFVLQDAFTWTRTTETYLTPAMRSLPGAFALAYESPAPHSVLWRVVRPSR